MKQKMGGGFSMSDDMVLFFICITIILYFLLRYCKRNSSYSEEVPLDPGTYRIGEDLTPGKCDLVAASGSGDICIQERGNGVWNNPFKLGVSNPAASPRYRNLTLHASDILEVNGSIKLLVTPPSAIADGEGAELTLGVYQFGIDVPPAKYDLKAESGDGQFSFFAPGESEFSVFQDMSSNGDGKSTTYKNLLCEEGSRMVVDGTLKLKLSKSGKQRGRLQKILDFINQDP